MNDIYEKFKQSDYRYECFCDHKTGTITRLIYENEIIPPSEVYDLRYRGNPEKYKGVLRIPDENDHFRIVNPGGCGDYDIFCAKESLLKTLEEWRSRVSPSHPLGLYEFEGDYVLEWNPISPEEEEIGWESVDCAEIVLVDCSFCMIPCYAIKLSNPTTLRKPNELYIKLRNATDHLSESIVGLGWVLDAVEDLGASIDEINLLKKMKRDLKTLYTLYSLEEKVEYEKGRE